MFVRRKDLVDQFASNFRETESGEVVFQPVHAEVGVPITWDEYNATMLAFQKTQMVNIALTWLSMFAAGAYGLFCLITEGRYLPFFIAWGVAVGFSFAITLRDGLGLLLPFIERRDELVKAMSLRGAVSAGQIEWR